MDSSTTHLEYEGRRGYLPTAYTPVGAYSMYHYIPTTTYMHAHVCIGGWGVHTCYQGPRGWIHGMAIGSPDPRMDRPNTEPSGPAGHLDPGAMGRSTGMQWEHLYAAWHAMHYMRPYIPLYGALYVLPPMGSMYYAPHDVCTAPIGGSYCTRES